MQQLLQQPFFQITVPLLFGLWLASWYSGKRFDDLRGEMNRRFDEIQKRLTDVESKVSDLRDRIWR